jgi:hypothetical protein
MGIRLVRVLPVVFFLFFPFLDVCGQTYRFGAGGREEVLSNLQEAGIVWTRVPNDIQASDISQGRPAQTIIDMFDSRVLEVQQKGLKVYAILNPKKEGSDTWPSTSDFASVLGYFVERYDKDGTDDMPGLLEMVSHWEIVNEYLSDDTQGNWTGFPQATYVECCQKSYTALKNANPQAQFSAGSIVGGELHDFSDFKAVIDAGVEVDFISYHGYSPTDFLLENATDDLWAYNPDLQNVPFIITECAFYDNPQQVSETQLQNAKWLPEACSKCFKLNTERIIYAEMTANAAWSDERLLWMTMIDKGGVKRPNYYTYKKMNEVIGQFESVTEATTSSGAKLYRYDLGSGRSVFVGWTDATGGGTIEVSSLEGTRYVMVTQTVPNTSSDVVDIPVTFNQWTVNVASGKAQVAVTSDTPVYIVPQTIVYVTAGDCGDKDPCYATIAEAVSKAPDHALLKVAAERFEENVSVDAGKTLTFEWGYNAAFTSNSGVTEIKGSFTARDKTIIKSGTIRAK